MWGRRRAAVNVRGRALGVSRNMREVHGGRSRCIPMVGSREVRLRFPVLTDILHRVVDLDQGSLNGKYDVRGEDRLRVYRTRDGALPRLQHLLHLAPYGLVDTGVRLHKSAVKLGCHI